MATSPETRAKGILPRPNSYGRAGRGDSHSPDSRLATSSMQISSPPTPQASNPILVLTTINTTDSAPNNTSQMTGLKAGGKNSHMASTAVARAPRDDEHGPHSYHEPQSMPGQPP